MVRNQTPPLIVASSTTPRVSTVATYQGDRARYNTFRAVYPTPSLVLDDEDTTVDDDQSGAGPSDVPLTVLNRNPSRYKTGKFTIKY